MVWLSARRDFTFAGTSYRKGDVFQATPIAAVQMRVLCAVEWAKAPAPVAEPEPVVSAPKRRTRRAVAQVEAVVTPPAEPEPPVAVEPVADPVWTPEPSADRVYDDSDEA